MKRTTYMFAHPESEIGRLYRHAEQGTDGDGHPDWKLIAINQIGLYVLKRKNWLEKLFRL